MKEILLDKGLSAYVDDCDYDQISQYKWTAQKVGNYYYATGWVNGKHRKMHRVLLELTDPLLIVDHKDRNGLNNQRSNLRVCTKRENNANRRSQINSSSKYVGVSWIKRDEVWRAYISTGGKNKYLGDFKTEDAAAQAYNEAAKEIHGQFASLNEIV
jgi:hypothetical protein